jgi:pyridoxal phosphate enzyme (YggS family)
VIAENLAQLNARIVEAARHAGRDPAGVRLVVVSKTVGHEKIAEAIAAGANLFGENRVQEAVDKIGSLGRDGVSWHFIGHLQKNKVKLIIGKFDLVHSVDSVALAERISRLSALQKVLTPVLIQVNISGEVSKSGVAAADLETTLRAVSEFPGIRVDGLMTIPPADPDPEKSRSYFAELRKLRDCHDGVNGLVLKELSMGMSGDFEVAIEEGATLVRVGTAIFGKRSG